MINAINYNFNPRYREDSDETISATGINLSISIHAIVKIATITHLSCGVTDTDFNPRYREDSDPVSLTVTLSRPEFQSTLS